MGKIKQLPYHEAQKIAAGEVVERPANIVKELLENAIDADATHINLYVEDGGKKSIRVVDNGCGMDNDDAVLCFNRHATSKLTHVDQLESIHTFGFRGEALASIAAVSVVTLITKIEKSDAGMKISATEHGVQHTEAVAAPTGTDITIDNLFYNIPARKKFLKSTQTEWRAIQLLFDAFCFAYPTITFGLFSQGKQIINAPTVSTHLKERIQQIWQANTIQRMIEIPEIDMQKCIISGFISDHQFYRYDRSNIYIFVNKRWIKNQHLTSALIKGYAHVIPEGRYPCAVINITVNPEDIDINIHPRKEEVAFLHPRIIETALQNSVKMGLEKKVSHNISPAVQTATHFTPFNFDAFFTHKTNVHIPDSIQKQTAITTSKPAEQKQKESADHFNAIALQQHIIIGQYKKTYILLEKEDGLFLVDQHAAHERILYELFAKRFNDIATVQLLFPHIITLSEYETELIMQHNTIFHRHGIIIEQCASNQVLIQSLPVHLKEHSLEDIIKHAIGWIQEYFSVDESAFKKTIHEKLQAQMACKAAVKAGDILTQEQMVQLLKDLDTTDNRFSCPHGRPTGWLISIDEIERKFKRKV